MIAFSFVTTGMVVDVGEVKIVVLNARWRYLCLFIFIGFNILEF